MPARKAPRKARKASKASKPSKSSRGARPAPRKAAARKASKVDGAQPDFPMRTVTGQLVVEPASDAIAWYTKVFGAKELIRQPLPNGRIMHAMLQLGDTAFMVADPFGGSAPKELNGAFLHVYHKDAQRMWDRALANGATATLPLEPQFWGDTYGQLRDPFGQLWSLSWKAYLTEAQKQRLQAQMMGQMANAP